MENWKEEFDNQFKGGLFGSPTLDADINRRPYGSILQLKKFIQTEIIEKLIEDIDEYSLYEGKDAPKLPVEEQRINDLLKEIQEDLRAKWLGEQK